MNSSNSEKGNSSLLNLDESAIQADLWHSEQSDDNRFIFSSTVVAKRRNTTDSGCSVGQSLESDTNITPSNNRSTKIHRCNFCKQKLSSKQALDSHINGKHINGRKYKCDVGHCQKRFPDIYRCKSHRLRHFIKKRLCKICEKLFTDLNAHSIKKHSLPIPYECNICQKQFSKNYNLQCHMEIHSMEHKCGICDECFEDDVSKQEHLRNHTFEN